MERLQSGGLAAVEDLYLSWREDFIAFAKKYPAPEDDVLDAYQDALIVLYENVVSGKLQTLTSSLKTYLFSVGKYTLINKLKANNKLVAYKPDINEATPPTEDPLNERQQAMFQALQHLGDQCQRIIELFYFQRQSIKSIVNITGLKNENTVKAHKSRCLKSLKEKLV
ncbi:MAG: sigma-70 family RNA polymerase sigma factor [Bacteroidota bacterium]